MQNHEYKTILKLALPMAGTQLITMASGFLCMTMLAMLGHDVLAASALIFSTQMSVMVFGMSFLFSLCILIGHAYGDKNDDRIGLIVQQGWTLAVIIGLPMMLFLWHVGTILIFFGQDRTISLIVQDYFHPHTWRVIPLLLAVCNQQLCYGIQKQKLDLIANVLGVVVLVVSSYVLIFGKIGFPALGVEGFAYAMTAQAWFYLLFTTFFFTRMDVFKRFDLFRYRLHKNTHIVAEMFKMGWPITLQISGEMLSLFVSAVMMGWLGLHALAAYQIIMQYLFLFLIPIFALSQATGVLIGNACGAKANDRVQKLGNASLHIVLCISVLIGSLFIFCPSILASAYIDVNNPKNSDLVRLVGHLFMAAAVFQFFDAIRNVLTGALRGVFETRTPMIIGLIVIWLIGIPLSYTFAFVFRLGPVGLFMGSIIAMMIGAAILWIRWRSRISSLVVCRMSSLGGT